jgi:hypothetical protein
MVLLASSYSRVGWVEVEWRGACTHTHTSVAIGDASRTFSINVPCRNRTEMALLPTPSIPKQTILCSGMLEQRQQQHNNNAIDATTNSNKPKQTTSLSWRLFLLPCDSNNNNNRRKRKAQVAALVHSLLQQAQIKSMMICRCCGSGSGWQWQW